MTKPHLRLRYIWSNGLQKRIWLVQLYNVLIGDAIVTSYYDTSKGAIEAAGEYFRPVRQTPKVPEPR